MPNFASRRFWSAYQQLPADVQELADKCYRLFERDPQHPSLHLKKVGKYWSVRVGRSHRAPATEIENGFIWIWIGTHEEYERLIRS